MIKQTKRVAWACVSATTRCFFVQGAAMACLATSALLLFPFWFLVGEGGGEEVVVIVHFNIIIFYSTCASTSS